MNRPESPEEISEESSSGLICLLIKILLLYSVAESDDKEELSVCSIFFA